MSDTAIVLSGLHCDAELTISEGDHNGQFHFGHAEVPTVSFENINFTLDYMKVERDANVDGLGGNCRYLRRATDQTTKQPACSGTVRLLWLHQDVFLILTASRRKEGSYERLGILHTMGSGKAVMEAVRKMLQTMQRSSMPLV